MNNLKSIFIIVFSLSVLFSSCKKKDQDNLGGTAFTALKVYVLDSSGEFVSGAYVTLYDSKESRDAGANSISTLITNSMGNAYFTKIEAKTYFIGVTKENGGVVKKGIGDTAVPIKSLDESAITVVIED